MVAVGAGRADGKYKPGQMLPAGTRAVSQTMGAFFREAWLEQPVLEAVERLEPLADAAGLTMAQFALRCVIGMPWLMKMMPMMKADAGTRKPPRATCRGNNCRRSFRRGKRG